MLVRRKPCWATRSSATVRISSRLAMPLAYEPVVSWQDCTAQGRPVKNQTRHGFGGSVSDVAVDGPPAPGPASRDHQQQREDRSIVTTVDTVGTASASDPLGERIDALVGRLSTEQKVQLLTGRDFWTTWPIDEIGLGRCSCPTDLRRARRGLGRARPVAQPAVRDGAQRIVGPRDREALRRRGGGGGPAQGRRRRARPDHQPAPLAPGRAALRGVQRGPGAHRRPGGVVRRGRAGERRRGDPEALHRERLRDRPLHRLDRGVRPGRCASCTCWRSRRP